MNFQISCNKCGFTVEHYNKTEEEIKCEIEKIKIPETSNHHDNYGLECNGELNYRDINVLMQEQLDNDNGRNNDKRLFDTLELFNFQGDPYCYYDVRDENGIHTEVHQIDYGFRDYLSWVHKRQYKGEMKDSRESVDGSIGIARYESPTIPLCERIWCKNGTFPDEIWYDLCDKSWKAVKITKDGWTIENPPVIFNRHSSQYYQFLPKKDVGVNGIYELKKLIGISDDDFNLWIIHLCTCFVPHIQHPMVGTIGPEGSMKTGIDKIRKNIVDPCNPSLLTLYENIRDDMVSAQKHYMVSIDNATHFTEKTQDYMNRLITGAGLEIRKLRTDKDSVIFSFRRCVTFNSVKISSMKSDFASRCIIFNIEPILEYKLGEMQIIQMELDIRPTILGSIFDIISESMKIVDKIKLDKTSSRFVDFVKWGCAIAEVIGIGKNKFIETMERNVSKVKTEISGDDIVSSCIRHLMFGGEQGFFIHAVPISEWVGAPEDLYAQLRSLFRQEYVPSDFPKTSNGLGQRIAYMKKSLKDEGIDIYKDSTKDSNRKSVRRYIIKNELFIDGISKGNKRNDNKEENRETHIVLSESDSEKCLN